MSALVLVCVWVCVCVSQCVCVSLEFLGMYLQRFLLLCSDANPQKCLQSPPRYFTCDLRVLAKENMKKSRWRGKERQNAQRRNVAAWLAQPVRVQQRLFKPTEPDPAPNDWKKKKKNNQRDDVRANIKSFCSFFSDLRIGSCTQLPVSLCTFF